jgi:hypothetical protein
MTHSTFIASIHLLEGGNLELRLPKGVQVNDLPPDTIRFTVLAHLWNDKRLTDLLDQYIEADAGVHVQ